VDAKSHTERVDEKSPQRDGGSIEVVDPFAQDAPIRSEAERRGLTRDEAIAYGRRLAEDENKKLFARRADYTQEQAGDRIARAERYAAWEYDGRRAGTIGRRA